MHEYCIRPATSSSRSKEPRSSLLAPSALSLVYAQTLCEQTVNLANPVLIFSSPLQHISDATTHVNIVALLLAYEYCGMPTEFAHPLFMYVQTLCEQTVDLVFTAHPTQAFRHSLLKKYAKVSLA